MPQQFHPSEETAPSLLVSSVTQSSEPLAPTDVAQETRRYDVQTVQKIVALAQEMQTRHRETLSPEEIENLGREIGVEPEFVRRALAQMESTINPETEFTAARITANHKKRDKSLTRYRPLTRRQRAAAMVPPALYLLLMPLTFPLFARDEIGNAIIWVYMILPAVLALCAGFTVKNRRQALWGGALFGLASLTTLMVNAAYQHWSQPPPGEFFALLLAWLTVGATLGGAGALLRQRVSDLRRLKRFRVRVVVETNEDDKANETAGEWI